MVTELKLHLKFIIEKTIFSPDLQSLDDNDYLHIIESIKLDYACYYGNVPFDILKIKFFPGLLATLFYRISRYLYTIKIDEINAAEFSGVGYSVSGIELYYSSEIGKNFKINHGSGTVVGARSKIGDNVILHHNVTLGDKKGGRPILKNNIIVYPGSVIIGDIILGNNVIVGANSFVDKNLPDNFIKK